MIASLPPAEKEQLRKAIIVFLAKTHPMEFDLDSICLHIKDQGLAVSFFAEYEALSALAFLEGLGFIKSNESSLGSVKRYAITSDGMKFYERSISK